VTATAPLPPAAGTYRRTAEVDCCLERLRGVRESREPAPAAAYAMLSDLEARYGGRPGVRDALGVSRQVLDQVGRLAAGSHPTKARKTERPGKPQVALADADLMWLERAMAMLVRRLAQVAAAGTSTGLPVITLADVP
jgi:hypothetical protein